MGMDNSVFDKAGESATGCQGSGKSTSLEHVKTLIADKLHKVAEGLAQKAAQQGGQSGKTHYGKRASEWLDQSADYVRQFDYKQADASVREYVRQSPGRSLLIAGTVGLIIGAILRRR